MERDVARAIVDRYMAEYPADTLAWDWRPATLMAAVAELYRQTGESSYREYLSGYMDTQLTRGLPLLEKSDDCAPAGSAIELYRVTGEARYGDVMRDVLQYLDHEAKRTSDGGISHLGRMPGRAPALWVDSLFMFGVPLVRWADATGDVAALDRYGEQLRIFAADLQRESGFFVHATHGERRQQPDVFWGRGNGWVLASAGEYLAVRHARGERDPEAERIFRRLADAVMSAQDERTGLWWTVVNRPGETYLETSASALFTVGLARGYRAGVLDELALVTIEQAMSGLRSRIVDDARGRPVVTGISGPTIPGTLEDYARVLLEDDLDYGVGAVLMALLEVSALPR